MACQLTLYNTGHRIEATHLDVESNPAVQLQFETVISSLRFLCLESWDYSVDSVIKPVVLQDLQGTLSALSFL